MKIGDLIRVQDFTKIGIITQIVKVNEDFYYWVYCEIGHILVSKGSIEKV